MQLRKSKSFICSMRYNSERRYVVKLDPWSVRISAGIPTRANSFNSSSATFFYIYRSHGNCLWESSSVVTYDEHIPVPRRRILPFSNIPLTMLTYMYIVSMFSTMSSNVAESSGLMVQHYVIMFLSFPGSNQGQGLEVTIPHFPEMMGNPLYGLCIVARC